MSFQVQQIQQHFKLAHTLQQDLDNFEAVQYVTGNDTYIRKQEDRFTK